MDDLALDRELDRLLDARAEHAHAHRRPRTSAQDLDRLVRAHRVRRDAVDLEEAIAGPDPHPAPGPAGNGADHRHVAVALDDLEAHAPVLALRADAEVLVLRSGQIRRVRVTEVADEPLDRGVVQRALVDLVDEARLHAVDHLLKEADAHVHVLRAVDALLEQPAARGHRQGDDQDRGQDVALHDTSSATRSPRPHDAPARSRAGRRPGSAPRPARGRARAPLRAFPGR